METIKKMRKIKEHKSYMRRQGNGWIVCHWDEGVKCYRESHEMPYELARVSVGTANCRVGYGCGIESHQHDPKD